MKKLLLTIAFLLNLSLCYATQVVIPTTWSTNDTVTNTKLNGINNAFATVINGGLDNTNADTTNGWHFFKSVAALPSAGTQGNVYYLTSDNSLNFDTGATFSKAVTVTSPSASQVPVYNGSSWTPTSITNLGFTTGMIMMWSGTIATIPSGWVLCNGSNGSPDLRNKFIVAADADVGGVAKSTITGSAAQTGGSTTISQGNLPSYNLSATVYNSNGSGSTGIQGTTNGASASTANISSGGSGTAYAQPFFALAFIMKS